MNRHAPLIAITVALAILLLPTLVMGRETVKLHPKMRAREHPVVTLAQNVYAQLLKHPMIFEPGWLKEQPVVVGGQDGHTLSAKGYPLYVRGLSIEATETRFSVVRPGNLLRDPETGEILGQMALYLADADLLIPGEVATVQILRANREILTSDRLIPRQSVGVPTLQPHVPTIPISGRIIAGIDSVFQLGQYYTTVINRGAHDGVEPGHILGIFHTGAKIRPSRATDSQQQRTRLSSGYSRPYDEIQLPKEEAGQVLVVRVFERTSYGYITRLASPASLLDVVANP